MANQTVEGNVFIFRYLDHGPAFVIGSNFEQFA